MGCSKANLLVGWGHKRTFFSSYRPHGPRSVIRRCTSKFGTYLLLGTDHSAAHHIPTPREHPRRVEDIEWNFF